MRIWSMLVVAFIVVLVVPAHAKGPYDPYQFLIGEWLVGKDEAAPAQMIMRFRWGTNRAYISHSASLLKADGEEPHFEGVFMYNSLSKKLDMLLMLDVSERAAAQESGTMFVEADGIIVREITGTFANGTAHFRQTYRRLNENKVETKVLRETPQGWVPTFPGSDHLIMTRSN